MESKHTKKTTTQQAIWGNIEGHMSSSNSQQKVEYFSIISEVIQFQSPSKK